MRSRLNLLPARPMRVLQWRCLRRHQLPRILRRLSRAGMTLLLRRESTPAVSVEPAIPTPAQNVPAVNIQPTAKPQTAKPAAPKFYVVEDGDSLSSIAKKVYGEQRRQQDGEYQCHI